MLRFIAHTIIGGYLQWQVYRQDLRDGGNEITVAFYMGDSVDFTTVLSDRNKVKSLKELEGLLGQNKIDWIHPGEKEWLFDPQAFTAAFDSPDIKSLDWLRGIIPIKPDFSFQQHAIDSERYQTVIEFHLAPTLFDVDAIKQSRLNEAYGIISHLEISLREIIERKLQEMHSEHWWRRGVPEQVRNDCERRKKEKEKPGEIEHHPINYAYVDNYKTIIIKRDNWDTAFKAVFSDKSQVEVCFGWAANVRDAVAHARPVSDDDYRMFLAGASWLQNAVDRA